MRPISFSFCLFVFLLPAFLASQTCNCNALASEVILKTESAYAGYALKKSSATTKRKQQLKKQSATISKTYDCAKAIFQYMASFRERHMPLMIEDSITIDGNATPLPEKHLLSGIWENSDGNFTVLFKQTRYNSYVAQIHTSRSTEFPTGKILAEFYEKQDNTYLVAYAEANTLLFTWAEINANEITIDRLDKLSKTPAPVAQAISPKTQLSYINDSVVVLHLPRFSQKAAPKIKLFADSIYNNASVKYLILDIRKNPGGDPDVYYPLRKLYYTQPITFPSLSFLVSREMREIDSLNQNPFFDEYKHLKNGTFFTQTMDTFVLKKKASSLKHIFVITDRFTGSTAEVFANEISQSNRVTRCGETTNGVVDYFRSTPFLLSDKKFMIQIPLGKLNWEKPIDVSGIHPQIDLGSVKTDWIHYISTVLIPKRYRH